MKNWFYCILFLLFFCPSTSFSQYNETDDKKDTTISNWQPGYIVLKNNKDTLYGYLNVTMLVYASKTYDEGIEGVKFRENKDLKKGTLKFRIAYQMDSLRYFGFGGKRFKLIKYTDETFPKKWFQAKTSLHAWVQIIEDGAIVLGKGFSESNDEFTTGSTGGSGPAAFKFVTPMFCLKKGDSPTVLVAAPSIDPIFKKIDYMDYELDEMNKEHFIFCINDDIELVQKISNKKLMFRDIEDSIKEYNQWVKNKTK